MHIASRRWKLPSLQMHALTCGEQGNPPLVLLHGFPEFSESWREVMPLLAAQGHFVVAPDLRGYGQSDHPDNGYDVETLANDIAELVTALGDRPAHVVAHDWGGVVGYHLAAARPELVDRLVVFNSPHPRVMARELWRPRQLLRSWYIFFFQLPWFPELLLSRHGGARVRGILRKGSVRKERLTPERLAPFAKHFSTPESLSKPLDYYRQAFRSFFSPKALLSRSTMPRIRSPFRLVWSRRDFALGPWLAEGYDRYFEQPVDVQWLDDVGHFVMLEAPELVARLILEHVDAEPANGVTQPARAPEAAHLRVVDSTKGHKRSAQRA